MSKNNSNSRKNPASSVVERKEMPKATIFGIALAVLAIAICVIIAVAMNPKDKTVYVEMKVKDYGTVILKLDGESAPKTVDNFVRLVNDNFYDGLTFHRVMRDFMIQGGCPNGNGSGSSSKNVVGEFSENGFVNPISHRRGVISMARSDDYDSGSCQFFICNADYPSLDGKYAAFGYVIEGMDVVYAITDTTVVYANPYSGAISDKSKQAVIEYIKVLDDYQQNAE